LIWFLFRFDANAYEPESTRMARPADSASDEVGAREIGDRQAALREATDRRSLQLEPCKRRAAGWNSYVNISPDVYK
jgi:hypothetical protein